MNEPQDSSGQGWTFAKVVGLIVGLIGMAGFGVCSLCGLVMSTQGRGMLSIVWMFVLPGLGITVLFFLLVRAMIRSARKRPPPPS